MTTGYQNHITPELVDVLSKITNKSLELHNRFPTLQGSRLFLGYPYANKNNKISYYSHDRAVAVIRNNDAEGVFLSVHGNVAEYTDYFSTQLPFETDWDLALQDDPYMKHYLHEQLGFTKSEDYDDFDDWTSAILSYRLSNGQKIDVSLRKDITAFESVLQAITPQNYTTFIRGRPSPERRLFMNTLFSSYQAGINDTLYLKPLPLKIESFLV